MKVCPDDLKPCMDDLCHGSGCLRSQGEDMLEICHKCKTLIDYSGCECESFEDSYDFYFETGPEPDEKGER